MKALLKVKHKLSVSIPPLPQLCHEGLSEVEREREKKETELDADCVLQTRLYTCK